jgi:hypothetical protein
MPLPKILGFIYELLCYVEVKSRKVIFIKIFFN